MKKTSSKIKTSPQEKFLHVLNVFFLLIAVFLCVYPFYYMVIYSLSDSTRASLEGIYFLPKGFTLDAYKMILKKSGFGHAFLISGARTVIQTILCLFGSSLFAYLVTKKDMIGRKFVYRFVVITMYLSAGLLHNHESIPFEQHFLAVYYSGNCKRILCHTDQNIYRTDSAVSSGVCGT